MTTNMNSADMKGTFKLPLVPGTTCGEELLRRNYAKTQVFGHTNEKAVKSSAVPFDFSSTLGNTGGGVSKSLNGSNGMGSMSAGAYNSPSKSGAAAPGEMPTSHSMGATQQSGNAPPDLDRRVLRFFAFFREAVQESSVEKERVRKVILNFFLEDGTMSVVEPRQDNSGIAFQGNMVKRHIIPKPDGSGPVSFDMLMVGETISFYGRTYFINDADKFTRDFFQSMGVDMPPVSEMPMDAHATLRARPAKVTGIVSITATMASNMKLSSTQIKASKQFFDNDRNVLRISAIWDDSKALYGEVHQLSLYYFLADDTFEVVEKSSNNSGRDPFPSFIRRQKMFKPKHGSTKYQSMANTLSSQSNTESAAAYTDADIYIGAKLFLFGRDILIADYDQHTRDHLRERYGITDYCPITDQLKEKPKPKPERVPPPPNGFGDDDDSLRSWNRLESKPPRKDNTKYEKFGNSVVKFSVKLDNGSAIDDVRRFVISSYLADDTIAIFEPVQRNSGVVGGKFLQRQKVKNPKTGKNYIGSDFFVGCKAVVNGFPFEVLATDERSMSYMEQNSSTFPHCNINAIAHKVQAMLLSGRTGLADAFGRADTDGSGTLDYKEFSAMVSDLGLELSEQEILTVLRYFDRNGDSYISYAEFVSRMLPEGSEVARDDRSWQEIHAGMVNEEHEKLDTKDKVALQKSKVETTTAAYAARAFLEAYTNRRTLFLQEFKFICDFSPDEKISEKEFRVCCVDKLKLELSATQLDALAAKLFPAGSRRVTYDEFIRLINSNSNRDNNLKQLRDRRM